MLRLIARLIGSSQRPAARATARLDVERLDDRIVPAGIDSVGVFRNGAFYLDTGAPGYQNERPFSFGQAGDRALAGDWDGDGRDQLGLFRNGVFMLQGSAPFAFGFATDLPIVGDWDGDGKDQAGVFRNGQFFLDTGPAGYNGEQGFGFGLPGDRPIAGDWNGDGKDEVGVYRNGQFYLDTGPAGYNGEAPFSFGLPGDLPTAGDWDGDGKDQVGVFRNGQFYKDLGAPGYQGEPPLPFGLAGDQPIAGKWAGLALGRPSYDYVPSVVYENGVYRMWWCGGVAGDYILYSQATDPQGPWTDPVEALRPTGSTADFDGWHVCDPSVIKVGSTYYMYYSGHPLPTSGLPQTTAVGVAVSQDGVNWRRAPELAGRPLVETNRGIDQVSTKYGAGQPSALQVNGYTYLVYSDSTGRDSNPLNGGGVYVIRSTDPLFRSGVEELTRGGFVARGTTRALTTEYKLFDAVSVDMTYDAPTRSFVMAVNGVPGQTALLIYDEAFGFKKRADIAGVAWTEGPGLVRRWDGATLAHAAGQPLPVTVFYSTGVPGHDFYNPALDYTNTWDLAYTSTSVLL
jgi:hypothetical protein